jgi:DNA-directed RNA polymerase subunit RPC12/RpoP
MKCPKCGKEMFPLSTLVLKGDIWYVLPIGKWECTNCNFRIGKGE